MDNIIQMPNLDGYKHDPLECSLDMEHEVRYHTGLGQISEMITKFGFTYLDFCNMTLQLDHYYHNWAEIVEADLEDNDFATDVILPSMLQPWAMYDYDDDDDE